MAPGPDDLSPVIDSGGTALRRVWQKTQCPEFVSRVEESFAGIIADNSASNDATVIVDGRDFEIVPTKVVLR